MTRHLSLLFLLVILLTTACQPSAGAIRTAAAQTQAVQSAFQAAVGAAQTQAAPPTAAPTSTLEPSPVAVEPSSAPTGPVPTLQPNLQLMLSLNLLLTKFAKTASAPVDARVVSVDYLRDSSDNAVHLDVAASKRANTQSEYVYAGILFSLRSLYGTALLDGTPAFPSTLEGFKITVYDENLTRVAAVSGNWPDFVAWKYGSLTDDQFTKRLLYE